MNIIICDDYGMLLDRIIKVCYKYLKPEDCIESYTSSKELKKYLLNNKPETSLFILNINMSEIDEMQLKNAILQIYKEIYIVFIAKNNSFIQKASGKQVIVFLSRADFEKQIGSIIVRVQKEKSDNKKIQITEGKRNIVISQKRIFSISAQRIYTILKYVDFYDVNTKEIRIKERLYRISMREWERLWIWRNLFDLTVQVLFHGDM